MGMVYIECGTAMRFSSIVRASIDACMGKEGFTDQFIGMEDLFALGFEICDIGSYSTYAYILLFCIPKMLMKMSHIKVEGPTQRTYHETWEAVGLCYVHGRADGLV